MARKLGSRDHVARHCSPTQINKNGTPRPGAFQIKESEEFLSVSWIEYFGGASVADNMVGVREEVSKHRNIYRKNARFAVIDVESAERTIMSKCDKILLFKDLQENGYPSHAGIYGYKTRDIGVAHTLAEMVGQNDMYSTV